ncbi:MAG: AEC family transporter [Dysgonamonadaceae bacterium]|jgi:predicted permease|nr:AEC family transporter [Dysgonamonadaceae bacterium]
MEEFLFSVDVVAPLFVLMAIGYFARKINFVSGSFLSQMNRFVFQFLLPMMLFEDIRITYRGDFSNGKLILLVLAGLAAIILLTSLAVHLFIRRRGQQGSMIQGIYRSNFLIYGYPLATAMCGDSAITAIAMMMAIVIPVYNVLAVVILTLHSEKSGKRIDIKKLLKDIISNPLIIGCCLGLIFGSLHIGFPHFIELPIEQISRIATPLALFVMGGEFQFSSLRNNIWKVVAATVSRLIFIPVIMLFIAVEMGFRGAELSVLVSLFATPTAVVSYIMADNMGNDGELSAQIVIMTTGLASFTIFLIVFFLRTWGYL